jgi:hypothetical protein
VRTSEGRSRAKARGVKLGRTPKLTPHQQREANHEAMKDIREPRKMVEARPPKPRYMAGLIKA